MRIVFDIDGVLANPGDCIREHLADGHEDWETYFTHTLEFPPIKHMVILLRDLMKSRCHKLFFVTGRPESNRRLTVEWIRSNIFHYGEDEFGDIRYEVLMMRQPSDNRPAVELKLAMSGSIHPDMVFEDDPIVAQALSDAGFLVLQVYGFRNNKFTTDRVPK